MDLYLHQLRCLLWKNYKIKRLNNFYVNLTFEILFPFLLLLVFKNEGIKNLEFEKEKSTLPVPMNDIHFYSGYVGFVIPNNLEENIDKEIFISNLKRNKIRSNDSKSVEYKIFENINEFNEYKNMNNWDVLNGLVIFNNKYTNYTIRVPGIRAVNPDLEPIDNYYSVREENRTVADLYSNEFSPIQIIVDQTIIQTKTNKDIKMEVSVGKLSKSEFRISLTEEETDKESESMIAEVIVILFLLQLLNVMKSILIEKESKQENGLITTGVHPSAIWLSHEIYNIPMILLISLLAVWLTKNELFKSVGFIFASILLFLYGLSLSGFSVVLTKIYKEANQAVSITTIFFILIFLFIEKFIEISLTHPTIGKIFCLFLSPVTISMALVRINILNLNNQLVSLKSLFEDEFGVYFMLLICNILIYHLIVIFIEFYYFKLPNIFKNKTNFVIDEKYTNDIEKDPYSDQTPSVEVNQLFKTFREKSNSKFLNLKKKNVKVVNGISFKVYKNEIFGILGHNGAGKSTLIKIMTGMLKADHGNIYYDGMDLNSNVNQIRKNIGICLQDNVLYGCLSVEQHIILFSKLKNVKSDISQILKDINMEEKRYFKVEDLSGGQKRKLCIGLALVGDPKYVFLDEPTTSLDPLSRRKIWELLLKLKNNKTIFLCTHYMDEADILSDRKMIINKGKIRCLGTSLYLKTHFNMKYLLNVETEYLQETENVIKKYIPEATFIPKGEDHAHEINNKFSCYTWTLPMTLTNKFSDLFKELDRLKENKNISNFSLSTPNLEELFVKLTLEDINNNNNNNNKDNNNNNNNNEVNINIKENENSTSKLIKLKENKPVSDISKIIRLLKYRFTIILRNKTFLVNYLVVTWVILGLFIYELKDELHKEINITFNERIISNSEMYKNCQWNYDIKNSNGDELMLSLPNDINNKKLSTFSTMDTFPFNLRDTIHNLTNVEEVTTPNIYYLSYFSTEEMEQIGQEVQHGGPYYVSSLNYNVFNNSYNFNIYYNDSMTHSLPSTLNSISNGVLNLNGINEEIVLNSHPLSYNDTTNIIIVELILSIASCLCISLIISFFGPMIIRERCNKLIKQLNLCGISNKCYWLSTAIAHFVLLIILNISVITLYSLIGLEVFHSLTNITVILILIIISNISALIFQYFLTFYFSKEENSYIIYILINYIPTVTFLFLSLSKDYMKSSSELFYNHSSNEDPIDFISCFFYIITYALFPVVNIPNSLQTLINIYTLEDITKESISFMTLFKFKNGTLDIVIGCILSIIFYSLLIYQKGVIKVNKEFKKIKEKSKERQDSDFEVLKSRDEDVLREYERIIQTEKEKTITDTNTNKNKSNDDDNVNDKDEASSLPIRVINIGKEYRCNNMIDNYEDFIKAMKNRNPKYGEYHLSDYGNKGLYVTALKNVTLGINSKECLGILGPNGSGKTTLLDIITYNILQSVGKVYYDNIENTAIKDDRLMMGYCPQNDTLWEKLTLNEHLKMYLDLRGYSKKDCKKYSEDYMRYCKIEEFKNKYPGELSGGTRRKLCILIALISFSNKIILDEPSSGMDPATRRYIWNIIRNYMNNENSSVVLTTHCMEEAELLCDRIAILVNGELHALGSSDHLKMKYNNTYVLDIHCSDCHLFNSKIKKDLPFLNEKEVAIEIKTKNRIKYTFKIHKNFGKLFNVMESYKLDKMVFDYSFSQTTLEDIFLDFAKLKENKEI